MKNLWWIVPAMGLLAAGCAKEGLEAEGTVQLTVHQSGQSDGSTGFDIPEETSIDAPPGNGQNFFGSCRLTNGQWKVTIDRGGAGTTGLREFTATVPDGTTSSPAASVSFALGTSVYAGSGTACTIAASRDGNGENDVRITATCRGLTASGDPRTVDASVSVAFENCDGT